MRIILLGHGRLAPCAIALALFLNAGSAVGDPAPPADSTTNGPDATAAAPVQSGTPTEAKPESAPAAEAPPEAGPKNLAALAPGEAVTILGQKVRGPDGKEIVGPIIDVLVDGNGQPRAAIIDFGGFLGVGSRKIAVDWQLLKFKPADPDAPIVLSLDRAQIQAAPEYKESTQPAEVVEPPATAPDAEKPAN